MAPPIPEDIRRFVLTSIPSVPHLEALLLLRSDAERFWTSAAVAERLYVSEKVAATVMVDLCQAGMTVPQQDGSGLHSYSYRPGSAPLRVTIDSLAELYARRLVDITHLIHSKLDRKAQQFADAFKWRKDA